MRIYSQEKKFYVYQYLRKIDSQNGLAGTPYYVGKGYNNRVYKPHGYVHVPTEESMIQFVSKNMNEADALQLEMLLIKQFGRIDLKTGCLRNMTAGGEGKSGHKRSKESINKAIATMRANGNNIRSPKSIAKWMETKRKNGTLNPWTPERRNKAMATRKRNGTLNTSSGEKCSRQIETRKRNGTLNTTSPNSIRKQLETKKRNGTLCRSEDSKLKQKATIKERNSHTRSADSIEKQKATWKLKRQS